MQEEIITTSKNDLRQLFDEVISTPSGNDRLLTQREAAYYLRISKVTLLKLRKEQKINSIQVSRKILFRKSELNRFLGMSEETYLTPSEINEQLGIDVEVLLKLDNAPNWHLIDKKIKYRLSDIYKSLKVHSESKEVNHG